MHSLIIGVTLGALGSDSLQEVKILMVAFVFHQFFEGLGIGAAVTVASVTPFKRFLLVLGFVLAVPIGIIIGIGISQNYDEESPSSLYTAGVLGSFASGNLIYIGMVEMMGDDFGAEDLKNKPGR